MLKRFYFKRLKKWILLIFYAAIILIFYNVLSFKKSEYSDKVKKYDGGFQLRVKSEMTDAQAELHFHRGIMIIDYKCLNYVRIGNAGDGGWNFCLDYNLQPRFKNCLIYSFGIGNDWSFDQYISRNWSCSVHSFDPSIDGSNRPAAVSFYKIGLSGHNKILFKQNEKWIMKTFLNIRKFLGNMEETVDYLKLDIEGDEWSALDSMLDEFQYFKNHVKQLGIEIHTTEIEPGKYSNLTSYINYARILNKLQLAGFRKWSTSFNFWGSFRSRTKGLFISCCYELVYVNEKFLL